MKAALLVPSILKGKGGAEKVAAQVANLIQRNGGTATIFGSPDKGATPSYPLSNGVDLRQVHLHDDAAFQSCRGEFEVVIGFAMADVFARIPIVARLLDAPYVIQECTNPYRMVSTLYTKRQDGCASIEDAFWLRQAVFAHANAIRFTVPEYAASVVPALKPFTYAFYNSLSDVKNDDAIDVGRRRLKIVCVGGMKNANKNGMEAVRAFADFSAMSNGWSLHLYGKNSFASEFRELMGRNPGLDIYDHGIVDDMDSIYGDASLLLIPSFDEGLPNVVVEAFSYGVPCIGFSDCPGVNHLIEDRVRGLLVPRRPGALASALTSLAQNDELHRYCSANCLTFARETFSLDAFERGWIGLLENARAGCDNQGKPSARLIDATGTERDYFRRLLAGVPARAA